MRIELGVRRSLIFAAPLLCALAWPARALGPALFPIGLPAAARAVVLLHPELAQARFELPVDERAHDVEPVLLAGPLERSATGDPRDARIRLHCQSPAICLPFYVLAHLDRAIIVAPPATAAGAAGQGRQAFAARTAPAMRSGAHAVLLIDSGRLHLRVPVTCLEAGAVGATIRVTGAAPGRKVYQAAVLDAATLRGTL